MFDFAVKFVKHLPQFKKKMFVLLLPGPQKRRVGRQPNLNTDLLNADLATGTGLLLRAWNKVANIMSVNIIFSHS